MGGILILVVVVLIRAHSCGECPAERGDAALLLDDGRKRLRRVLKPLVGRVGRVDIERVEVEVAVPPGSEVDVRLGGGCSNTRVVDGRNLQVVPARA